LRFILDANILISALIKDSITRRIIIDSFFDFFTPEYTFEEIEKHLVYISRKNSLTIKENKEIIEILSNYINVVEIDYYIFHIDEAYNIIGNIDERDVPYIALALAIKNNGIWTDDDHFQQQNKVKIWKTKDMIEKFNW
jgi:predicted nucleic acid-binding protein